MKKSKRLLALLLSVMLIMGTVCSVPFTANAENVVLEETGVSSLKFNTLNILGGEVEPGKDYYSISDPEAKLTTPLYAWFDAEETGYYVLSVTNNHMTEGNQKLTIGFADHKDKDCGTMSIADGETQELSIKIEEPTRYYIKLCYEFVPACYGGNIDLKLTSFADAEPDKMDPAITIKPALYFDGSVDVAEDKDYIFVQTADNKKYSITLDNRNDSATAFKAEVYDSKSNLLGTVTTEAEDSVTLELAKPTDVTSYYICVTGIDGALGKYGLMMNEVKPVAVEVPLNEECYDSITGFDTEGGRDYLKFTTIDKDAYYTITVKNINITTHSWAADNEVQADVLNYNDEKLGNINLTKGDEKSITLKLDPDTTYYMRVYNNYLPDTNGGNYKVQISYVLDPDKNEMENATDWTLEEKYYGDLAAYGDKDWFKITTNEETDYTFTLKNTNISTHSWSSDNQFRGVIYNDKKEALTQIILTSGNESNSRITLEPNTEYYVAIWDPQGTTGEYSFDLSKTVIIDEEAVGMANAVELTYAEEYYDSISDWTGDNKVDYLKFTTLSEPAYYTIYAKNININTHSWSGDHQVQVKLWNEHKEELDKLTLAEGSESSMTMLLDANTTYYLRINNNENVENNGGNYKVLVTYVLDPEGNELENGKTLRIGERYYGNIAAKGDKDYFKITTGKETDLTLLLKNINIPTHSWSSDNQFRVVLYNNYSEELGKILATKGDEGNIKVTLEPDTTYYLGVWDPDGTSGEYNVILAESVLLGDVNLDGNVKIQDATLIQKYLAKLSDLNAQQLTTADVTEDGKVNIKDATAIQKYIAKIQISFRVGELILSEIQYDEPSTDATVEGTESQPATQNNTEPTTATVVTTTVAAEPTEEVKATEASSTSAVTEPEEVITTTAEVIKTEPTEQAATTSAEVTETTSADVDPQPDSTEATTAEATEATTESKPEETVPSVSYSEKLKELAELCETLTQKSREYEPEAPLAENSNELKAKAAFGFDTSKEVKEHNEYYKFCIIYADCKDIDEYTEQEAMEAYNILKPAYDWFNYYVTELHPTPSGRVIYFENTANWIDIYVSYYKEGEKPSQVGDRNKMTAFTYRDAKDMYSFEVPYGYDYIQFIDGTGKRMSQEINLSYASYAGFRLNGGTMAAGSSNMIYNYKNFSYKPFERDL